MAEQKKEENIHLDWPPLESDPRIFNDYFHSIGLKKEIFFHEMLSLVDYSAFLSISGPLLGVILNYTRNEKEKEESFPANDSVPYFMRQTKKLDNACGLIAAIHCFSNAKNGKLEFEKGSVLENFFEKATLQVGLDCLRKMRSGCFGATAEVNTRYSPPLPKKILTHLP